MAWAPIQLNGYWQKTKASISWCLLKGSQCCSSAELFLPSMSWDLWWTVPPSLIGHHWSGQLLQCLLTMMLSTINRAFSMILPHLKCYTPVSATVFWLWNFHPGPSSLSPGSIAPKNQVPSLFRLPNRSLHPLPFFDSPTQLWVTFRAAFPHPQ